ncbi:MAG: hypothetical protein ACKVXR_06170 [Planctomycetota bacterium]
MKLPATKLAASVLILAAAALTSAGSSSVPGAAVEYSFREPPLNSLGVRSLAELRGKPIVIDFWGKN